MTRLKKDMDLVVEQAFEVSVNDGGKEKKVWTTSTTVADFLKQQELKLKKHDKIKPALHSHITKKKRRYSDHSGGKSHRCSGRENCF